MRNRKAGGTQPGRSPRRTQRVVDQVGLRIPPEMTRWLDTIADRTGRSRNAVIEDILTAYRMKWEGKP